MIPLRLRLKNFLCYRDNLPPISLEHIHLACLCGNNGAGKSALLDAITWALWGKARSGSHHESLVHSGQDEMEVELEFLARGQRYRVIRKYSRARAGRPAKHLCDLQVADGTGFRSISGSNLRETQNKIEKEILRLDYETFINSAFLLQGRANEFTRKSPAERKEVLGQILGLSFYDDLCEKARERQRECRTLAQELRRHLAEIERELDSLPRYQEEKLSCKTRLDELENQLRQLEEQLQGLDKKYQQLQAIQAKFEESEKNLQLVREELLYREQEREKICQQLKEIERLLARAHEIETNYYELLRLRERERELDERWRTWHSLEEEKRRLESSILKARADLEKEVVLLSQESMRLDSLRKELARVETDLELARADSARWEKEERGLAQLKEECQQLQDQVQSIDLEIAKTRAEVEEVRRKIELLQGEKAICPLCRSELGPAGIEHLKKEYLDYEEQKKHLIGNLSRKRKEIEQVLLKKRKELETKEAMLARQLPQVKARVLGLEREREKIRIELGREGEVREKLNNLSARLERQEFALDERKKLRTIEDSLRELDYNIDEHERIKRRVREASIFEEEFRRLEEGRKLHPTLSAELARIEAELAERRSRLQDVEEELRRLRAKLVALPQLERELALFRQRKEGLEQKRLELKASLAVLEDRIRRCLERKRELSVKENELRKVEEEEHLFGELSEAFGKGGVQALLIEQMLPLLKEEANILLSRLTEGRMSLEFRTQKSTREGKTIETLEIEIGDELGTRNYEMYSGGEAFRIDFALRVALARLIARRAGAPLPILIIDEGFGSQDAQGRERLVEAIKAVAPEFEKVLVITHMDELKELFDTRIEVTRTEHGSSVQVL